VLYAPSQYHCSLPSGLLAPNIPPIPTTLSPCSKKNSSLHPPAPYFYIYDLLQFPRIVVSIILSCFFLFIFISFYSHISFSLLLLIEWRRKFLICTRKGRVKLSFVQTVTKSKEYVNATCQCRPEFFFISVRILDLEAQTSAFLLGE